MHDHDHGDSDDYDGDDSDDQRFRTLAGSGECGRFRGRERGEGPTGHHLPPELAQVAGNRNNCQKKGESAQQLAKEGAKPKQSLDVKKFILSLWGTPGFVF